MLQSRTVLVSHGSGALRAGPVPVLRQLREDYVDFPISSSSPAWRRKRSNFSYIFKLLLIVAEVAVLRQPGARQNPTAQDLVLARASRAKDKPKPHMACVTALYSPLKHLSKVLVTMAPRWEREVLLFGVTQRPEKTVPKPGGLLGSHWTPGSLWFLQQCTTLAQICREANKANQPPALGCAKLFWSLWHGVGRNRSQQSRGIHRLSEASVSARWGLGDFKPQK